VTDELHDVVITKPGCGPVRIGPVLGHQAEEMAGSFTSQLTSTAHPEGTAITTERHRDDLAHDDPVSWPADAYDVADKLDAEPGGDGTGREFPDLFARLHARHGYEPAARLWRDGCVVYDQQHEPDELPEHEAAE
jgi:hypothetical protein